MEGHDHISGISRTQSMGLLLIIVGMATMFTCTTTASAGFLEDIPTALGETIGAEDPFYVGGAILSLCILASIALVCGVAGVDILPTTILLLAGIGVLVVMTWLDWWLLALAAILTAVMFGRQIAEGVGGG